MKTDKEFREMMKQSVMEQIEIINASETATIKDRIELVGRLLPYTLPKWSATAKDDGETDVKKKDPFAALGVVKN